MPQIVGMRISRLEDAPLLEDTDALPRTSELSAKKIEQWDRKSAAGNAEGQEARIGRNLQ